jgi:deazaflavin-dependent oxidoreductase (nitroreductase family)
MRRAWFWIVGRTGTSRLARWLHPPLYRWTGGAGAIGRSLGLPVVLLTTTGRQSGRQRTTAIWAYPDGDALVVVGTNGGRRSTPAWVFNLRARPEATVQVRRERRRLRGREAVGDEYERLWKMVVAAYPGYAAYRDWLDRPIPLVVLERAT